VGSQQLRRLIETTGEAVEEIITPDTDVETAETVEADGEVADA
jgi:hypothetical protein